MPTTYSWYDPGQAYAQVQAAARELLDALDRQLGGTQSLHVREARAALRKLLPATPPGPDPRDVAQ